MLVDFKESKGGGGGVDALFGERAERRGLCF